MTPTKIRTLIPEVAQDLAIEESKLLALINFYYKDLKEEAEQLNHLRFKIEGLGMLTLKGWKIKDEIYKRKNASYILKKEENLLEVKEELRELEAIQIKWEEQEIHKKEIYKKREEFYKNLEQ